MEDAKSDSAFRSINKGKTMSSVAVVVAVVAEEEAERVGVR